MNMHRFLKFRRIGSAPDCDLVIDDLSVAAIHARLSLRSDGALWLIESGENVFQLNRGAAWIFATRVRLCGADRIRLGDHEIRLKVLCDLFGVNLPEASANPATHISVAGRTTLIPLSAPAAVIEDARRNPGTGQIEPSSKETR